MMDRGATIFAMISIGGLRAIPNYGPVSAAEATSSHTSANWLWNSRQRRLQPMQSWLALPTPKRCGRFLAYERIHEVAGIVRHAMPLAEVRELFSRDWVESHLWLR